MRVEHGLRRAKRLGGDDEQRALGAYAAQHMAQLMAIDVGDEMQTFAGVMPVFQRLHHHLRPEVRAANAYVHHVGNRGIPPYLFGQRQHGVQRGMHLGQRLTHGHAPVLRYGRCRQQPAIRRRAQQPMHRRAVFGRVDGLTGKRRIAPRLYAALPGQLPQQ